MGMFDKGPSGDDLIKAQTKANQQAAGMSAVDQYSPWGSTTFTRGRNGVPTSQRISLTPGMQGLFDTQMGLAGTLGGKASQLARGLSTDPFSIDDVGTGDQISQTMFNQGLGLLQPEMDRQRNLLRTEMSERGIPMGSEIDSTRWGDYDRNVGQSLNDLSMRSILAGGQEQDRLIRNKLMERNQGMNEIAAMMGGSPQMPMPGFQQTQGVQPVDAISAMMAGQQGQNSMKSGLGSMAGAAIKTMPYW